MKIHKLQNSNVRKVQQEQRKQEETGLAKKHQETSLPPPHALLAVGLPNIHRAAASRQDEIHKQLERPREEPATLMTLVAEDQSTAGWPRAWHKGPPCRFGLFSAQAKSF